MNRDLQFKRIYFYNPSNCGFISEVTVVPDILLEIDMKRKIDYYKLLEFYEHKDMIEIELIDNIPVGR